MAVNLYVDSNFSALEKALAAVEEKPVRTIVKRSMNKGLDTLIRRAGKIAQKERFLKLSVIKSRYFTRGNPSGNLFTQLSSYFGVSNQKISMLHFVKGPKTPRRQKGIPVRKRKRLRFEVQKGRRFTGKGAIFMAKLSNNRVQVFRRGGVRNKIHKQSLSGFGKIFSQPSVKNELSRLGQLAFLVELEKGLEKRLNAIK